MTIRIIEGQKIDFVDNLTIAHQYKVELQKLENDIKKLKQEKQKLTLEIVQKKKENLENVKLIEQQNQEKIFQAEAESKNIVENAKNEASEILANTQGDNKKLLEKAKQENEQLLNKTQEKKEEIIGQYREQGIDEGFKKGFAEGKVEREKITELLKVILGELTHKKEQVVANLENHIVDITFLITRKIVKNLTDNDEKLVKRNILSSLKEIKGEINITVQVNSEDLSLVKEHKEEIFANLKNLDNVKIMESPLVERGGCMIETDYSLIDARIATQLNKIEESIREVNPLKTNIK